MTVKATIMDRAALSRAMMRITHEILERNRGSGDLALVGIRRRGVPLAGMLAANLAAIDGAKVPVGSLDITLYRDDLTVVSPSGDPCLSGSSIPFDVNGRKIVLVDDVIYTGRTARSAIDALFRMGRPSVIQLAVLIDRGHRELPIRPDYVGKNIPTSREEYVAVMLDEYDSDTMVCICEP